MIRAAVALTIFACATSAFAERPSRIGDYHVDWKRNKVRSISDKNGLSYGFKDHFPGDHPAYEHGAKIGRYKFKADREGRLLIPDGGNFVTYDIKGRGRLLGKRVQINGASFVVMRNEDMKWHRTYQLIPESK